MNGLAVTAIVWACLLVGFVAGTAYRAWLHREDEVTVGAMSDAYARGRHDGRREAWAGEVDVAELERMSRVEAQG